MYFKKLVGKKCYLSPIDVQDSEKYTQWINDMEVGIGMLFSASVVTESMESNLLERLTQNGPNMAIIDLETEQVIGNVGFVKVDQVNRRGEVGIFIGDKNFRGKGYGTEAMQLLLDFGFSILNLHTIYLTVYGFNKPAHRSYLKAGFKEAGRLREAKQIAGKRYDEIYMDILASEYESVYVKGLVEEREACE